MNPADDAVAKIVGRGMAIGRQWPAVGDPERGHVPRQPGRFIRPAPPSSPIAA